MMFWITAVLLILYGVLLLRYRSGWKQGVSLKAVATLIPQTKFSIIIVARNESESIKACLDSISRLRYPEALFETLVVDDHSEDDTATLAALYPKVQLIQLSEHVKEPIVSYKKKGIALAIEQSNGEYIVTTDADCVVPSDWLRVLDQAIQQEHPAWISGPVVLEEKSNFLNRFEALDFMMLQGVTGGAVRLGMHAMSNGANLCYRKSAYEAVGGFENIDRIAGGDDILLMEKMNVRFPKEIFYAQSTDAIVTTRGSENIHSFLQQRIRWASKGKHYKDFRIRLVALLVYGVNVLLAAYWLAGFFNTGYWLIAATGTLLKATVELSLLIPVARFFKKTYLLRDFLWFQPIHIFYTVAAGFLGLVTHYQWKGRSVR
ncbi:MAG: glycosyltransferase [Bacteroidetes bacterium]|nr:glycosyltransferase [Bacteroidota bacterium]